MVMNHPRKCLLSFLLLPQPTQSYIQEDKIQPYENETLYKTVCSHVNN